MMTTVQVEDAFADFVRSYGGEVIEDLVGASPDFRNADYLFRSNGVVAELKRLVEDKSEDERIQQKIQDKFDRWMNEGVIGPNLWAGESRIEVVAETLSARTDGYL